MIGTWLAALLKDRWPEQARLAESSGTSRFPGPPPPPPPPPVSRRGGPTPEVRCYATSFRFTTPTANEVAKTRLWPQMPGSCGPQDML